MPTWSDLLKEVTTLQQQNVPNPLDLVRRKYLTELNAHTGRDLILYASRWSVPGPHFGEMESISEEDVQGLMEVVHGLRSKNLDIILHSPGGSPEATEAIVSYLRKKFQNIRVIVPHAAMSAATMWACAANRIVMGKQSSLGPIDPQLMMVGEQGTMVVPAQAVLDQFELAKQECRDPEVVNAWLPMLGQYGPALLVQCNDAINLSQELVKLWLRRYMFAKRRYAARDALRVARGLSNHSLFKSHARHLDRETARSIGGGSVGLVVDDLEDDQKLQDLVLSVYHATMMVFSAGPAAKIIENQNGKAFIKIAVVQQVNLQAPSPPQSSPGALKP